jgi:hypothetical protein
MLNNNSKSWLKFHSAPTTVLPTLIAPPQEHWSMNLHLSTLRAEELTTLDGLSRIVPPIQARQASQPNSLSIECDPPAELN